MKQSVLLLVSLFFLSACGRDETSTYQVPKEPAISAPGASMGTPSDNETVLASHAAMTANAPVGPELAGELPAGWAEQPGSGMRKASYTIDGTSIDFYLISLSMGDLASNVNRWRGQVGLEPISVEEIEQAAETLEVDGRSIRYIEVYNDDGGKGIIAAIIDLAPQYWYFTAKGSVAELKAHASEIRAFLGSITIQ